MATATAVNSLAKPPDVSEEKWKEFTDSLISVSAAVGSLNSAAHKATAFDMWSTVNRELQLKITALRHQRKVSFATDPRRANSSEVMALSYDMLGNAHRQKRHNATVHNKAYVTSLAALQGTDLDMNQRDLYRLIRNIGDGWKNVTNRADSAWKSVENRHADYVAKSYLQGIVALGNNEHLLKRAHVLSENLKPDEVAALNRAVTHLTSERTAQERSDIVEEAHRRAGEGQAPTTPAHRIMNIGGRRYATDPTRERHILNLNREGVVPNQGWVGTRCVERHATAATMPMHHTIAHDRTRSHSIARAIGLP